MFTFPVDSVENLVGGFGPHEWVFAPVPSVDEGADLARQIADRGEGPAPDGLSFDDPEPDLDQVQPRAGGRGEVHRDPRVRVEPVTDLGLLVGGAVVHHQMQLLGRVGARHMLEEPRNS